MPVSKKRKKEKVKKRIYFRCRYCGERVGLSNKSYCISCTKFNQKVNEYGKRIEFEEALMNDILMKRRWNSE